MAFVKLDCGMLDSTLWIDRCARELFVTALLMARPLEVTEPMEAINVRNLDPSGFVVPPGWYGFVEAAGPGIVRRALIEDAESGLLGLERLGTPEKESRTPAFEGRRMVRVNGGFIILNYDLYRTKDHTAAERSKRYRAKKASRVANVTSRVASRSVTQAEAYGTANAVPEEAEAKKKPPTPLKGEPTTTFPFGAGTFQESVSKKFNEEWVPARKGMGKKPKDWTAMFQEQVKWLGQFTADQQLEILSQSIRNGWQGLFAPKTNGKPMPPKSDRQTKLDREFEEAQRKYGNKGTKNNA